MLQPLLVIVGEAIKSVILAPRADSQGLRGTKGFGELSSEGRKLMIKLVVETTAL